MFSFLVNNVKVKTGEFKLKRLTGELFFTQVKKIGSLGKTR